MDMHNIIPSDSDLGIQMPAMKACSIGTECRWYLIAGAGWGTMMTVWPHRVGERDPEAV